MLTVIGYRLDSHHIAAPGADFDGKEVWYLFEFGVEVPEYDANGMCEFEIPASEDTSNVLLKLSVICDPDSFEWNGRMMRLANGAGSVCNG